ncbi:MAG TPA: hypothetical protein VF784_12385 [Anaerolineales bacterium]
MHAKLSAPPLLSSAARLKPALWIVALLALAAAGAWARNTWANGTPTVTTTSTAGSAITPALQLAVGTINLEGTQNAVDAASAANLLPLWQLLDELDSNASSAPQEITAVVEQIRLNMTATQIQAIEAMSIETSQLAPSSSASGTRSNSQAASAGAPQMMSAPMAGGVPMDGGGPMPSRDSSQSSSTSKSSTTLIQEVIQLLEKKLQS